MVQLMSLLAMSLDRFLAMRSPGIYHAYGNEKYAASVVVLVWATAVLATLPVITQQGQQQDSRQCKIVQVRREWVEGQGIDRFGERWRGSS
jgi:hypothetical protein